MSNEPIVEETNAVPVDYADTPQRAELWKLVASGLFQMAKSEASKMQHTRMVCEIILGTFQHLDQAPPEVVERIVATACVTYVNQLAKDQEVIYAVEPSSAT